MPRVLYCARTCPPLVPPFPLPASQQHMDLDDPNSPTSPLPPDTNNQQPYYEYDSDDTWEVPSPKYPTSPLIPYPNHQQPYYVYDSDEWEACRPSQPSSPELPPTPELPSLDTEGYSYGDECFHPYLENVPDFANIALEHYNSQPKHEVKYQLTKAIVSHVIRVDTAYYHSNFMAKTTLENSKEEFFFAELRLDLHTNVWVPVSIVVLEENERVGGFSELLGHGCVDPRHCFGCGDKVKHPLDGSLYEAGHFLVDNCCFHRYIEVLPATQPVDMQN